MGRTGRNARHCGKYKRRKEESLPSLTLGIEILSTYVDNPDFYNL
jgi:hypothetical protein